MKILQHNNDKRSKNKSMSYWQSYSDLMSALLLVFVLLMSGILLQSAVNYEAKLEEQRVAEEEIEQRKEELASQQQKLDVQQEKLNTLEDTINRQKELLKDQQDTLDSQKEQLDKIIGIKVVIIEDLVDVFSESNLSVVVDNKTGAIKLDSSILFDVNRSELKPEGKAFLDKFVPLYFGVLTSEEIEPYISEIIIEGHTDTTGTYAANLKLSQERALSVTNYIFDTYATSMSEDDISKIRELTTANGRSWNDLIYFEDGTEDQDSSRRVEFKFRLKNDDMIEAMAQVLDNE